MGILNQITQMTRADLNEMIDTDKDPEKALDRVIVEMQYDLNQLRQAVAKATVIQGQTEQKYNKSLNDANTWHQRAALAFQKGDEYLAREALVRKKSCADAASKLKVYLERQTEQVDTLKCSLAALEQKFSEATTKKALLTAQRVKRIAEQQLESSNTRLFELLAEKFAEVEDLPSNTHQLESSADLETRLRKVEQELEAMQVQLKKLLDGNLAALNEVRELLKASHPQSAAKIAIFSNTQVFGMRKPEITAKKLQL